MALLPAIPAPDPTLDAVDRAVEARQAAEKPRPYLGMSAIGEPCSRRLWYGFRWAVQQQFPAGTLYKFEDGHRTEDLVAARLRLVPGLTLHTIDPSTGRQIGYTDHGGHFRGHMDGAVLGLLQAPKTWHVWECKATNDEKQGLLLKLKAEGEKAALAAWDPIYWAQAVVYMHYSGMDRHYLTCTTPGGRSTISVRTDADADAAKRLAEKALRIIVASTPPERISEDPEWYQCGWCPAHAICHGGKLPNVSCRTCAHATPELDGDGRWTCALWRSDIPGEAQHLGCDGHRYIPALVVFAEAVDADAAANWIEYRLPDGRTFLNGDPGALGPRAYTSAELRAIDPALIGDDFVDAARTELGAQVVA
ncbi:hypothetical protein [Tahibacter harae]|uniref:PD-(D/E)XK nuclease superfamily protein n=1 Tax=Tahibacter harae TaxID=2963937 RepID=A0ABT1QS50_9GAMM|nr:hypothetical protein [Tahibacter harae]MCQ4165104.1 hypothetical protein [Tahibacter harae]